MENRFKPGDEVICTNDKFSNEIIFVFGDSLVKFGKIYTIRATYCYPDECVNLNEIILPYNSVYNMEIGFKSNRFKKIDKKDLEIFYDCVKVPEKVMEDA